ncbi:MAG TPA: TolC family protein [Bryobacteraceae bacterium]|nr:TolC family protein [Bryobacteraceae bacterium]
MKLTKISLALLAAASLWAPALLHAQGGDGTNRAIQLPLSGRTGQPGSVDTVQTPLPGGAASVNTLNSTVQVQGAYQGSVPSAQAAGAPIALSLDDAVKRGLEYNLGTVGFRHSAQLAEAQQRSALSHLLPNVNAYLYGADQQTDLAALGFNFTFPGFSFPTVLGPYHYFDARARAIQTADLTTLRNYRAAQQNSVATQYSSQDARDLVVLAVTGAYLRVIAAGARVDSAKAQVATAQATYQQASDRHDAGLSARIDVTRSQVELQMEQQRLTSQETDLAKQRINLGRLIGLPPGQQFTLSDTLPYAPLTSLTLDQALSRAYSNRPDLKAAQAQVRAAELTRKAAMAERYPSAEVAADYGVIGVNPTSSHGTFTLTGTLRIPIWQGGRISADTEQAAAALEQRQAEYQDLRGRVDAEVREAFLDLTAAASQVQVAENNRTLAQDTLQQARDRFAAGVADTIEVVQAQEAVAAADQDYITSLFAHNLAKTSLARAMGQADQGIKELLEKR